MRMINKKEYISISQMAQIHHISRQTLIYYDHIGLLKPVYTDEHNYRYYSVYQIPYLREICFLKNLGIKLDDIKKNMKEHQPSKVIRLLSDQKEQIDKEIRDLNLKRCYLQQRINFYENVLERSTQLNKPKILNFPERKAVFVPFSLGEPLDRAHLHLTLMRTWDFLLQHEMLPSNGFGTYIKKDSIHKNDIFEGAGTFITLPYVDNMIENVMIMPAGNYICMTKYGMPYDDSHLHYLLEWMEQHNYEINGDIFDLCLLDTTFYEEAHKVDLCCIQIPIK